jgi:chromatin segregation and condensation protein Rec8/ScpA/Scc1 (kleisin family)
MTLTDPKDSEQLYDSQLTTTVSNQPVLEDLPEDFQTVLDHILFHKALISDESDGERLNHYLELINELNYGTHMATSNPYDKSIAIAFQLAVEYHLDPWDIDLNKFARVYKYRIKEHEEFDLIVVGKIIHMAYTILKLKSDRVLSDAENVEEDEEDLWEPAGDWYTDDIDYMYTTVIQKQRSPPLKEMVWRKGKRPVTLLELVGALEEASKEAEIQKILNEKRRIQRERDKVIYRARVTENMHKEDLEADITMTYSRICEFNGHPIPFSDICDSDHEDKVTTLISSLYLAERRKINIWQKEFPYGKILIENLRDKKDRAPPLPGQPAEDRTLRDYRRSLQEDEMELAEGTLEAKKKGDDKGSKGKKRKKEVYDKMVKSEKGMAS